MSSAPDPIEVGKRFFQVYYRKHLAPTDIQVSSLPSREFAFSYFGEEGMHRHISFGSLEELVEHLRASVPRHAYYSSAYYREPGARNMDEKGWLGADLIFDIDVDHVETPCKELHDSWVCKSCGAAGKGSVAVCPRCGSELIKRHTWVCENCINVARDEALRLVEFLQMDFGLSPDEIFVTFSGHRGFHVHVEATDAKLLSQDSRREIVDYIRGLGLDARVILTKVTGGFKLRYGAPALGWYGRIARWALVKAGNDDPVLSLSEWHSILGEAVAREAVAIDENVTIDVKRLIRLPNSLHGKTGLKAAVFSVHELENADVLERAKVFTKGEVVVELEEGPQRVLDVELTGKKLVLPTYAALYLLLNGAKLAKFEQA